MRAGPKPEPSLCSIPLSKLALSILYSNRIATREMRPEESGVRGRDGIKIAAQILNVKGPGVPWHKFRRKFQEMDEASTSARIKVTKLFAQND